MRQRRDGTWSLSGLLRPDEVEDVTGIDLPANEDYDTIAGSCSASWVASRSLATWPR